MAVYSRKSIPAKSDLTGLRIRPTAEALRIVMYYTVFGVLWILLSDWILAQIVRDTGQFERLQTYKGTLYVVVTAALFFFIIYRRMHANRVILDFAIRSADETAALNEALRQEHELSDRLLQESTVMVFLLDPQGMLIEMNTQAARLTGYEFGDFSGVPAWDVVIPDSERQRLARFLSTKYLEEPIENLEIILRTKRGELLTCLWNINHLNNAEGRPYRLIAIGVDITERIVLEHHLEDLAYIDPYTRLPNRAHLTLLAEAALDGARRNSRHVVIVYFSIGNLKQINGSFGHGTGNRLLAALGTMLRARVPATSICASVGSEDFVVVFTDLPDREAAVPAAERIMALLRRPWSVEGHEFLLDIDMGISVFPEHGDTLHDLIQNADMAMCAGLGKNKGPIGLFRPEMADTGRDRLSLMHRIHIAIENDEFMLVYQPVFDLRVDRLHGFEALIRWHSPDGRLSTPDVFIPIAEETGQICDIDRWVFGEACRQIRIWRDAGYAALTIAVNLSAKALLQPGLIGWFRDCLTRHGIDGVGIEVEITETAYLDDFDQAIQVLEEIRGLGLSLALDDFGSGYSSLTYLKNLPISRLKIDRAFLREIGSSGRDAQVFHTIVDLAHQMGLSVTSEGVESEDQLRFVRQAGCDLAQGYLLARPAPPEAWTPLLAGADGKERGKCINPK